MSAVLTVLGIVTVVVAARGSAKLRPVLELVQPAKLYPVAGLAVRLSGRSCWAVTIPVVLAGIDVGAVTVPPAAQFNVRVTGRCTA